MARTADRSHGQSSLKPPRSMGCPGMCRGRCRNEDAPMHPEVPCTIRNSSSSYTRTRMSGLTVRRYCGSVRAGHDSWRAVTQSYGCALTSTRAVQSITSGSRRSSHPAQRPIPRVSRCSSHTSWQEQYVQPPNTIFRSQRLEIRLCHTCYMPQSGHI